MEHVLYNIYILYYSEVVVNIYIGPIAVCRYRRNSYKYVLE